MFKYTGKDIGVAICRQITLSPNTSDTIEFALAWDMPKIHFFKKMKEYKR